MTTPPAPRAEWKPRFAVGDKVRSKDQPLLDRLVRGVYEETRTYSLESTDHIQRFGEFKEDELEPAPAPWKLPEPPEGRWHRVDWEEAELPQGWRPLLDGELPQRGDLAGEKDSWSPRTGQFNIPVTSENSEGKFVFLKNKTLRPLHLHPRRRIRVTLWKDCEAGRGAR
jgi:hypothetical protein